MSPLLVSMRDNVENVRGLSVQFRRNLGHCAKTLYKRKN